MIGPTFTNPTLDATDGLAAGDRFRIGDHEAVSLKTGEQVERMRRAGRLVSSALDAAANACRPGVTTQHLDDIAAAIIEAGGGESLCRDYPSYRDGEGFPGATCISVNDEIVHGIPGLREIQPSDVVTIDCGARLDGWCCDAARTVCVGPAAPEIVQMVETVELALDTAIGMIRPGITWSEIAGTMQAIGREGGYGVVQGFVGHGIGRHLHEPPRTPAFVTGQFVRHHDFTLRPGMTLAIEPMLALGTGRTRTLADGWTVVTIDGQPACHVEHTVAVTSTGADVLTSGPER